MAYSIAFISALAEKIKPLVADNHLSKISQFNKTDFVFALSRNRKQHLYVCLENSTPFITLTSAELGLPTLSSLFFQILKNEITDAAIIGIAMVNGDRIIKLSLEATDDAYNVTHPSLFIELIPNHPNMILVSETNKIISAFRPSASLDDVRPILRGLEYVYPENHMPAPAQTVSVDLEKVYEEHAGAALRNRRLEKYHALFDSLKKKLISLKKKQSNLSDDLVKAEARLADRDIGTFILTNIDEIGPGSSEFSYEGTSVVLNPRLSAAKNAEKYYKSYQKAKITINRAREQIAIAKEQSEYLSYILIQAENAADDDLEDIINELTEQGYLNTPAKPANKKKKAGNKAILPYFVTVKGIKIGFGHSNIQNDYLTFKLARNQHLFFHVKDGHGAHVIIFDDNPGNDIQTIAAEMALALSKKEDGDVIIAQKSELKKLPTPGLVRLGHYQTVHISKVRASTIALFKEAHR